MVGRKGPTPFLGLAYLRALPGPLGAATISEIYFGICSKQSEHRPKNSSEWLRLPKP